MSNAGQRGERSTWMHDGRGPLVIALAAGVTLALGYGLWAGFEDHATLAWLGVAGQALVWISLGLGSVHGLKAAWESLRELRPDIDVLMVVGAYLSAAIGHPEEGALLLFMFSLAGALEDRALARTKDAITRLHKLMPTQALVRRGGHDSHEEWQPIDPTALVVNDVVLIRPGELVPTDGIVIDGSSLVDESTLTGESYPRKVDIGGQVFAGTLNQSGALEVKVSRPTHESSLSRIMKLVTEAQETRPPAQRVIDRFSTPYAVTVMLGALSAFLWLWLGGVLEPVAAAQRAITLLVVASPCALVIATPTATLCGLSRAARSGVLIKGGDALERLAGITRIAIDKTGTLTTGKIEVTHVESVAGSDVDALLSIAMAAEQRSTHPIAAAIVRLAERHHLRAADLATLTNVPGRGVEGLFQGTPVRIGSLAFCEELIDVCFRRHTRQIVDRLSAAGSKTVLVAHGGQALVLALADKPREGAELLRDDLREAGVQGVTMLTGDSRIVAERVAAQLGIEDVRADLLPENKVEAVRALRDELGTVDKAEMNGAGRRSSEDRMHSRHEPGGNGRGRERLAMIGDGVNDAPALAVADVGLAMGGIGSDAALETADVVLLHDDLNRIAWSLKLARRVKRIMRVNLMFATGVIAVLAVFTLLGKVPLPLGVIGHEGSTLLVVANSLRLLAHKEPGRRRSANASSH